MSKVESADLILKLYDLRRETKMREARNWIFSFNPTSADEYFQTMMDPEVGGYLRMVSSYWDMAAAMVNHGAIDADLFNETAGEHVMVFAKIEPFLAELREKFLLLTAHCDPDAMTALFERLAHLEDQADLSWLRVTAGAPARRAATA